MIFPIAGASYLPYDILSSSPAAIETEGTVLGRDAIMTLDVNGASVVSVRSALDAGIYVDEAVVASAQAGAILTGISHAADDVVGHTTAEGVGVVEVGASAGAHAGTAAIGAVMAGRLRLDDALAALSARGIRFAPPARASAEVAAFEGREIVSSLDARTEDVREVVAALDAGLVLDALVRAGVDVTASDGFTVIIDIIDDILASARGDAC